VLGASALAAPALAFDGAPVNQKDATIPVVTTLPGAAGAVRSKVPPATQEASLSALQYAAEGGHPIAQWKLGRMYANGDGVAQDDVRASNISAGSPTRMPRTVPRRRRRRSWPMPSSRSAAII